MNVHALKTLVVRDKTIDELVAAHAELATLKASYQANEVTVPSWIDAKADANGLLLTLRDLNGATTHELRVPRA